LSQLTGLTFTAGDGTADATMTFSGTVADINAALNNLVYDFDEVANPSATSDTLTLTTPWSAGGTSGNVVQVVPITLVKAPVITPITNILVGVGGTITPAAFTVTDADTAANALTYTITSSNTNLIPNSGLVRTGGTGATGSTAPANAQNSLAITPTTNRTGITTVTIAVSDGNITTNTTFTVTVSPIVGAPDLISTSDTGSSSTDNITSDNTPTFSVTLGTGIQAGDVVGDALLRDDVTLDHMCGARREVDRDRRGRRGRTQRACGHAARMARVPGAGGRQPPAGGVRPRP
jgi:hypothetical protein